MSPAGRKYKVTKVGNPAAGKRSEGIKAGGPIRGRRKFKVVTPGKTAAAGPPEGEARPQSIPQPTPQVVPRPTPQVVPQPTPQVVPQTPIKPAPQVTPPPATKRSRHFRVKTPGRVEPVQTPSVKIPESKVMETKPKAAMAGRKPVPAPMPAPAAVAGPKPARKVRSKPPGRDVTATPATTKPPAKVPGKVTRRKAGPSAKKITITGIDRQILTGLDKGPTTFKVLAKRTSLAPSKLLPGVKKLQDSGYIRAKQDKGVKRFRLSKRGYDYLHPVKFPFTLFKRKRKGRRRKRIWGKRLTKKQRLRRLDMAIGTFIVILVILVSYQSYLVFNSPSSSGTDDLNGNSNKADTKDPVIVWTNQPEIFDDPFGTLAVRLLVFDPGEAPSGIDANKIKIQYAFASSIDMSEPNISNWTQLAPNVNLPYVNVTLRRNWAPLNGYFIFIRCYAFDNSNNVAINTFKVLIYL